MTTKALTLKALENKLDNNDISYNENIIIIILIILNTEESKGVLMLIWFQTADVASDRELINGGLEISDQKEKAELLIFYRKKKPCSS